MNPAHTALAGIQTQDPHLKAQTATLSQINKESTNWWSFSQLLGRGGQSAGHCLVLGSNSLCSLLCLGGYCYPRCNTHTHTHTHTHTQTHTHTGTHAHTDTHAHTHADTDTQRHTRTHTHTHKHTDTHAHTDMRTHTQTQTHKHTHTHIHTDCDFSSTLLGCTTHAVSKLQISTSM